MSPLLLDTHVLLWWLSNPSRLSRSQRTALETVDSEHAAIVSGISLWEIAMLDSLGRIELSLPLRDWLDKATAPPLVRIQGITPPIAAEVARLPDSVPGDPADRLILATARVLGCRLVTSDAALRRAKVVPTI